jgi:hypothetical protein
MAAIGDGPTEAWTAELRRTGRVVFPLRRQPLLRQIRSAAILLVLLAVADLPHALKAGGVLRIVGIVVTSAVVIGVCVSIWHLVTQRPVLTIDSSGVRLGRRRFVPWSEIDALTDLDGPPGDRWFTVVPNVRGSKLRISQQHIRNVVAVRYWLGDVVEEQRRTTEDPQGDRPGATND